MRTSRELWKITRFEDLTEEELCTLFESWKGDFIELNKENKKVILKEFQNRWDRELWLTL